MGRATAAPVGWEAAVATNHRAWWGRAAEATGGHRGTAAGVPWAIGGTGSREQMVLLGDDDDAEGSIDGVLAAADAHDARSVCIWAMDPAGSARHGPTVLGRGLSLGWRPRWMWLPPDGTASTPRAPDDGFEIVERTDLPVSSDVPYADDTPADARRALTADPAVTFFVALVDGAVVGEIAVHLTDDVMPLAVIYSTGVAPAARRRGVGAALTVAAASHATDHGVVGVALNATEMGAPVYARVGFVDVGSGQTWSHARPLPQPTEPERALTEAVARDDVASLDAAVARQPEGSLAEELPCGMTPFRLAAELRCEAAAAWLLRHGAPVDAVGAWDLGWSDRLAELLREFPSARDLCSGPLAATPLHEAVQRGDVALLEVLLDAGADSSVLDGTYRMPPAGWARFFGRPDLASLIEQRAQARPRP